MGKGISGAVRCKYRCAASSASYSTFASVQGLMKNNASVSQLVQQHPAAGGPAGSSRPRWQQPAQRTVAAPEPASPAWCATRWPGGYHATQLVRKTRCLAHEGQLSASQCTSLSLSPSTRARPFDPRPSAASGSERATSARPVAHAVPLPTCGAIMRWLRVSFTIRSSTQDQSVIDKI